MLTARGVALTFGILLLQAAAAEAGVCVRELRVAIPEGGYQDVFEDMVDMGLGPVWVDGYDVDGSTYLNAIFSTCAPEDFLAVHGASDFDYQAFFDAAVNQDYRLERIDTYLSFSTGQTPVVHHAALFSMREAQSWAGYHSRTLNDHQSTLGQLSAMGLRPSSISFVEFVSSIFVSASWDDDDVGSFTTFFNLNAEVLGDTIAAQEASGRFLTHIDGYRAGGLRRFSAIFDEREPPTQVVRVDLDEDELTTEHAKQRNLGRDIEGVTGYDMSGEPRFAAIWVPEPDARVGAAIALGIAALLGRRGRLRARADRR